MMEPTQRSAVRSGTSEDPTTRPAPHPTVVVPARLDPAGSWALADGRWLIASDQGIRTYDPAAAAAASAPAQGAR